MAKIREDIESAQQTQWNNNTLRRVDCVWLRKEKHRISSVRATAERMWQSTAETAEN